MTVDPLQHINADGSFKRRGCGVAASTLERSFKSHEISVWFKDVAFFEIQIVQAYYVEQ